MRKDIFETISIHSVSTNSDESRNRLVSGEKVVSTTITDRSITAGCEAHRLSLWTEKKLFFAIFFFTPCSQLCRVLRASQVTERLCVTEWGFRVGTVVALRLQRQILQPRQTLLTTRQV